jgi:hypothetical protein
MSGKHHNIEISLTCSLSFCAFSLRHAPREVRKTKKTESWTKYTHKMISPLPELVLSISGTSECVSIKGQSCVEFGMILRIEKHDEMQRIRSANQSTFVAIDVCNPTAPFAGMRISKVGVIVRRVPITQIAIDIAIRFSRGLSHKKKK